MIFNSASPLSIDETTLVVAVDNEGMLSSVRSNGHDERLRQAVLDVLRVDRRIDVILDPAASAPAPASKGGGKGGRAAAKPAPAAKAGDEPSPDDPDLDGDSLSGEALAMRELGGTIIGEIGT